MMLSIRKPRYRMNRWRHIVIAFVIAAGTIISGCATSDDRLPTEFETARLFGMVYGSDNQPVIGVRLTLDGAFLAESDIEGRFLFPEVSRGEHVLVAEKAGYERLEFPFTFQNQAQVIHLRIASYDSLVLLLEDAFEDKAWGRADRLIERLTAIDGDSPELLYLTALRYYLADETERTRQLITEMAARGIESKWIDALEERLGTE